MTNDFEFEVTGGKAAVKRYTGSGGDVVIPARTPDGTEVTALGKGAFFRCIGLTAVTIPDGVTVIGKEAFCECRSLTGITIPESVKEIGEFAFSGCTGIKEVTIPAGVTGIGRKAFSGCTSLIRFRVPDEASADWNGLLEAMDHPAASKASVYMPLTLADGVLFSGDGKTLVLCFPGKEGRYCVPAGVTGIGPYAFWNCASLTEVVLPDGVVTVGEEAFSGCRSLEGITIPGSVSGMESRALYDPGRLIVTLPAHSRAEEYCRHNGLRYRCPGEERVRSLQDDDPEAYTESVFRMMEVYEPIVIEGEWWNIMDARFLRMGRMKDDTDESCLYRTDCDWIIPEKEIGEPCPDMEKRIDAFFEAMDEESCFPIGRTELLEKCSAVNAAVYELPAKIRSHCIRYGDALLIRACDLWYFLAFDVLFNY